MSIPVWGNLVSFESTSLWKQALAARSGDEHEKFRERLRVAYHTMRENVSPLVSAAHIDCPGLTVHDVTHLDALWETASLIGGDNFALNPAEAFVLGGAILLHDAGMAVASYEGGIAEIRKTAVWLDAIATADGNVDEFDDEEFMFRHKGRRHMGRERFHDQRYSERAKRQADFAALRYYHAQQAEFLAARAFQSANSNDPIFLIEDRGLRDAYGQTIGKIAHSHHWDIDRLSTALRTQIGAMVGFPAEWSVNAIKVATLLRCADAAHIDATRAPTMLFSLLAPSGLSRDHWNFQNRLLKTTPSDGKIVLTSSRAFAEDDAEAWWLCYETVQLIDREIRQCNSLLASGNDGTFAAQGIAGVESPKLFSNYVECDGWIPVNIDVKVSDAKGLASTLGGRNLYGDGYASPLKELIQNAADAIRARRSLEVRDADWGKISIALESKARENAEGQTDFWLHIDDNGIGMSEAVLTGPLIDLGNSFWKSNLLSFEYPGLQAKKPRTIGKFGIGFFSVFILGDEVKVASRPFGAAETDGKVVHFKSLERKPVFRTARSGEIPRDAVTRVSVKLHHHMHYRMENEQIQKGREQARKWNFSEEVMWQCATLDVNVTVAATKERKSSHHRWDWWAAPKERIAESVFGREGVPTAKCRQLGSYCDFLHWEGKVVGFGVVRPLAKRYGATEGFVSVQGISYLDESHDSDSDLFVGIQDGVTHDASRKSGFPTITRECLANWASQQASALASHLMNPIDAMSIAEEVRDLGGDSGSLPVAFAGGTFLNFTQFGEWLGNRNSISLPASDAYHLSIVGFDNLSGKILLSGILDELVLISDENIILGEASEFMNMIAKADKTVLDLDKVIRKMEGEGGDWLPKMLQERWGKDISVEYLRVNIREESIISDREDEEIIRFQRKKRTKNRKSE
jgi:hypothetical protein